MESDSLAGLGTKSETIHPPIRTLLDALSFRLARLVALNQAAGSLHFRNAHGLSLNEWRVLGLVNALSPVTPGAIRRKLLMDKGQLSRTIKGLTDRGLLEPRPASRDARSVELRLTEAGQALHDEVLVFTAERNEAVVEPLTREECDEFLRILEKLTVHNQMLHDQAGLEE